MIVTLANGTKFNTETNQPVKKIKKSNLKGVILYHGASVLDGEPIVCIATFNSSNEKTGDMIQTWIIRSDMSPLEASKTYNDQSVCGNCPHRRNTGGSCYITLHQAPAAVYKSFKNGNYENFDYSKHSHLFTNRNIRLGSYGDPAAVPFKVLDSVVKLCKNHTGYTHQVDHSKFDSHITDLCMVSVDTEQQAKRAQQKGYKTFRVKTDKMRKIDSEVICLSQSHNINCNDCGLCNGSKINNIVVDVHGALTKRFIDKFERII